MTSPPSRSKITVKDSTSNPLPRGALSPSEILELEEIHSLLLNVQVFVSIADELEPDKRWTGRMMLLIGHANDLVNRVTSRVLDLVHIAYKRQKSQESNS